MNRVNSILAIFFAAKLLAAQADVKPQEATDAQISLSSTKLVSENPPRGKDDGKNLPPRPKGYVEKQRKVDEARGGLRRSVPGHFRS